jgi:hypothetical protein
MTYRIFLCEDRVPFLMDEMPHGKVKVVETDSNKMVTVDVTIDDSFDLLKVFHAGVDCGEKASQPKLA